MAYEPTVWSCGDTITADKMNKLEQGLAECCGGGTDLIVTVAYAYGNVTYASLPPKTVWDALESDTPVRVKLANNNSYGSYDMAYLTQYDGNPDNDPYGVGVQGTHYRFSLFPTSYNDGEQDVIEIGSRVDIFHPNNTDEYYWVYGDYYAGKLGIEEDIGGGDLLP